MKINNHVFAAVTVAILWGHTEALADAPRDLFRVDLRTARVVCCNTNDADSVMAAAELEKHLNMVVGERTPQADGFVFAVGEKPLDAPPPKVFESCARVDGKRLCFWGEAAEHGVERSRGPLFAVYEFLDKKLGVKWTYPGDENTVFQSQKEVQLQEGESWSFTPPFEVCSFRSYPGAFKRYRKCPTIKEFRISRKDFTEERAAMDLWYLRMRLASRNRHDSGHNFTDWQRRFLKDHPEWFAYIEHPDLVRDGKPGRGVKDSQARRVHGCYSCPTLPQAIVDDWVAEGAPRRMNLCLNDGKYAFCHCQECLKLDVRLKGEVFDDHLTDRVVYFYNQIVPLALKVRPDVDVCAYIYSVYHKPPRREKLLYGDHMTISYVPPFLEKDEYLKELKQWHAAGMRKFYLRPNYMCYSAVFPRGLERYLFDNFKMSVKFGAIGVMYDGTPRPVTDLEYYTICSLAQRPEREFDEILDEFLSRFGEAASEARAYFAHVRARSGAILASTQSLRKLNVRNMLDDSELSKFAAGGHTLADLETELAILKPGLDKTLAPADALRFKRLVLRAENSVLTFRFLLAGMGKDDTAFQAAADRLFAFRVANLNDLGLDEGQRWTSLKNFERPLWERSSHKPPKLPPKR